MQFYAIITFLIIIQVLLERNVKLISMSAQQILASTEEPVMIILTHSNALVKWVLRAHDVKRILMIANLHLVGMEEAVMMQLLVMRVNVPLDFQVCLKK